MSNVIKIPITSISEKGKALCALEAERSELYSQSRRITEDQVALLSSTGEALRMMGEAQQVILKKIQALDDIADKLVHC